MPDRSDQLPRESSAQRPTCADQGRCCMFPNPPRERSALCSAVVSVFTLAAEREDREGKTYGEWVRAVTARASRYWTAMEEADRV